MENIHEGQKDRREEIDRKDPDEDIRGMRNIQVVAKYNYKATRKDELSIKKGKLICTKKHLPVSCWISIKQR